MIDGFKEFKELFNKKMVKMRYKQLDSLIQKYIFLQILKDEKFDQKIIQKINESKVIVIDKYYYYDKECIILCFESHLIIIDRSQQSIIKTFLSRNNEDKLYFVPKTDSSCFKQEIDSFLNFMQINANGRKSIFDFWRIIVPCLTAYLIKKSYFNTFKDRINKDNLNIIKTKEFKEDEFITLRTIGLSNSSTVYLKYHIKSEKLYSIKSFYYQNDKLLMREMINYQSLNYPFLSKIYGEINTKLEKSLVIEFINGQSLLDLPKRKLNLKQKVLIIIEILYSIQYLHRNNFIYRDLKPNNLIIDQNQRIVLFDFDRMIKEGEIALTKDFNTNFVDPDLNKSNTIPSFKNDIYSIGKLICFIFTDDEQNVDKLNKKYPVIYDIYMKCIDKNTNERLSISELIVYFKNFFLNNKSSLFKKNFENEIVLFDIIDNLLLANDQNDPKAQNLLGSLYLVGKYVKQDINKAIHYFSLAANNNFEESQLNLGVIYLEGKFVKQNINKSIYYFTSAANKNNSIAQDFLGIIYYDQDINKSIKYLTLAAQQNNVNSLHMLGYIYYTGEYVQKNINKSIKYLTIAANLNCPESQYFLGIIYSKNIYVPVDIKKAIYYFKLAADQNFALAQHELGLIYYNGDYIKQNVNKAPEYLTLSANQNYSYSQLSLGLIYYGGYSVKRNINKSIYYLSYAANQNMKDAQFLLGTIFYDGKFISKDIDKSIYYFKMAANQNMKEAQFCLGLIYYEGKYAKIDINQSIYYFTLASNQNNITSQIFLGRIYYEGKYVQRDINKSIHSFTLAANQNDSEAQLELGFLYYEGKLINRDIKKAIYYFSLSAKQNNSYAQSYLGEIYIQGRFVVQDINKAIHYFTLAANQNDIYSQIQLGLIYSNINEYNIKKDDEKALHYLSLAVNSNIPKARYFLGRFYLNKNCYEKAIDCFNQGANKNEPLSQLYLGFIYLFGGNSQPNLNKSIHYFNLAANNGNVHAQIILGNMYIFKNLYNKGIYYLNLAVNHGSNDACFSLGVIYSMKDYFDIKKSIHYYKEASSLNNEFAKNNLAMIFRNDSIKNLLYAIELLKEAIKLKDIVSMYNLSHIYFYDEIESIKIETIIELLIKSSYIFSPSKELLGIVLIRKYKKITFQIIKNEIELNQGKYDDLDDQLANNIYNYIIINDLNNSFKYEKEYQRIKINDYMYNLCFQVVLTKSLMNTTNQDKVEENSLRQPINESFYEGLGELKRIS